MADAITITDADRVEAENIMEQFLVDRFQETADFSKGSAVRDLAINAMAYTFAYLKKERDYIRARQSLLLLGTLTGTDVDDAVDEILSNWFIHRKTGRKSTGRVTIYLSRSTSITIATTTAFYKTADLIFYPNSASTLAYGEDDLLPIRNSSGEITSYAIDIAVIAEDVGTSYDVDPGPFADYTRFSPYILRVENQNKFSGGGDIEATPEMLDRSATAISERSLNSPRAIDATLRENFSSVNGVSAIGYGDPEMIRDLVIEEATRTRIHAGGHTDVFLRMPITESKTFTGAVGGEFVDARPLFTSFRDPTVSDFTDLPGGSVQIGDIIEIYNNAPASEANRYIIKSVSVHGLEVSGRSPFPDSRPSVEESLLDGTLAGGDAEFASTEYEFFEAEASFVSDGQVTTGANTLTSISYLFTLDDVGKWLRVTGSSLGNNGVWKIVTVNSSPVSAELRDAYGIPPSFTTESNLYWDLLLRTDHGKFIRIDGASVSANNGTWKIQEIIDIHTVKLINAQGIYPTFTAEPAEFSWQLCTKAVEYSVGSNSPSFNNKIDRRFSGQFTNIIQFDGRIALPGEPIYLVKDVSFADVLSPYKSSDGRVYFPNRVNKEPEYFTDVDRANLQYQILCPNPAEAQSGWHRMLLDIGWPDGLNPNESKDYFNGQQLRVTYDTLTGYDEIWTYMTSGDQRILCGSVVPRGLHPIYITVSIRYRLSKNASEGLDEDLAKQTLADYINSSSADDPVDLSDLMYVLRSEFPVIGYIEPFDIYYDLLAPDGRVIHYKTSDVVTLSQEYGIDPSTGFIPNPSTNPELVLVDPLGDGVSTNTVCYLSLPELITFTQL